jgi:hypothetical protein
VIAAVDLLLDRAFEDCKRAIDQGAASESGVQAMP